MTGHSSALLKLCRAVYAKKSIRNLANIFELLDGSIFLHFHVSWTLLAWNHFPHHDRQWRKWRRSDVNFYMHIFINHARAVWVCTCGCATTRERERKNKYKWKAWCVEPGGLFGFSVLFCFVSFCLFSRSGFIPLAEILRPWSQVWSWLVLFRRRVGRSSETMKAFETAESTHKKTKSRHFGDDRGGGRGGGGGGGGGGRGGRGWSLGGRKRGAHAHTRNQEFLFH